MKKPLGKNLTAPNLYAVLTLQARYSRDMAEV